MVGVWICGCGGRESRSWVTADAGSTCEPPSRPRRRHRALGLLAMAEPRGTEGGRGACRCPPRGWRSRWRSGKNVEHRRSSVRFRTTWRPSSITSTVIGTTLGTAAVSVGMISMWLVSSRRGRRCGDGLLLLLQPWLAPPRRCSSLSRSTVVQPPRSATSAASTAITAGSGVLVLVGQLLLVQPTGRSWRGSTAEAVGGTRFMGSSRELKRLGKAYLIIAFRAWNARLAIGQRPFHACSRR